MITLWPLTFALLSSILSAGIAIAGKLLATNIPSTNLTLLSVGIASIAFLPFIKRSLFTNLSKHDLYILLIAGFFGIFLSNVLFYQGLATSSALHASLITSLIPGLMLICTCFYFKRLPTCKQVCAFSLALFGVFFITTDGNFNVKALFENTGNLLILVSIFCWVIYSIAAKQKSDGLPATAFTCGALIIGTLLLIPLSMHYNIGDTVHELSTIQWLLILYIAIMGTGLQYYLYGKAIEHLGPDTASYILYSTTPVFVVFLTYFLFNDPITTWELLGTSCVLVSLAILLKS